MAGLYIIIYYNIWWRWWIYNTHLHCTWATRVCTYLTRVRAVVKKSRRKDEKRLQEEQRQRRRKTTDDDACGLAAAEWGRGIDRRTNAPRKRRSEREGIILVRVPYFSPSFGKILSGCYAASGAARRARSPSLRRSVWERPAGQSRDGRGHARFVTARTPPPVRPRDRRGAHTGTGSLWTRCVSPAHTRNTLTYAQVLAKYTRDRAHAVRRAAVFVRPAIHRPQTLTGAHVPGTIYEKYLIIIIK